MQWGGQTAIALLKENWTFPTHYNFLSVSVTWKTKEDGLLKCVWTFQKADNYLPCR